MVSTSTALTVQHLKEWLLVTKRKVFKEFAALTARLFRFWRTKGRLRSLSFD